MFLINLVHFLLGWVEWEAQGGFPERFLNLAAREHIPLFHTRRQDISLLGGCYARQYRRLRPLARRSGVRLRLTARHGMPFKTRRYRQRQGLAVGLALYILLLQIFPHYIWSIDIRGNREVSAAHIEATMADLGVKVGTARTAFSLRDIQLQAIQSLPELSWLAVNLEGSIAHIDVSERITAQNPPDQSQPTNLKAICDGQVVSTRIVEGQAVVHKGDAVVKGMLLASGIVDTANGALFKHARGEVMALTTRTFTTSVPLQETQERPQARAILRPTLQLFSLRIPLYTNAALPDNFVEQTQAHPLTARGVRLPVGITNQYIYPVQPTLIHRSESQAAALAQRRLEEWKRTELDGATIQEQKLDGHTDTDAYTLTATFRCIQNIAVEEPIHLHP